MASSGQASCDVLVVGAGPTGLTLAVQLIRWGVSVRLVDLATDRVIESRALAVQPRTLEVLRSLDLANDLIRRGNPAVHLRIHGGGRTARARLFDIGLDDTAFPFLLFVSQAETEAVLGEALAAHGLPIERGVELVTYRQSDTGVVGSLRHPSGKLEEIRARYIAGCDGMNSSVRSIAGIPFVGAPYPDTFLLADLDVDGLEAGTVNAFLSASGPLLFFPLERPAPWRVITMRTDRDGPDEDAALMNELQRLADAASGGRLTLRDPVWASAFRLHHRGATRYASGRAFLAGDAAHVHSPVGAQGMNTGIQDSANLGWKLALVCRGLARPSLLDSYDAERRPVGEYVLRFTDRAFSVATSTRPLARLVRAHVAPRLVPVVLRFSYGRALAFRTVSQLGVRYRSSPAVQPTGRRLQRSPRPGDRLPDARLQVDGRESWLHAEVAAPALHLLLFGDGDRWDAAAADALAARYASVLKIVRIDRAPRPGVLHDRDGLVFRQLHIRNCATILLRPDGYLAARTDGVGLDHARRYLERWLAASLLDGSAARCGP